MDGSSENKARTRVRLGDMEPSAQPAGKQRATKRAMRLTDRNVTALKINKAGAYLVWDDPPSELAVQVQPSGIKSFYAFYTFHKQATRSMSLGRTDLMTVEAAREEPGTFARR